MALFLLPLRIFNSPARPLSEYSFPSNSTVLSDITLHFIVGSLVYTSSAPTGIPYSANVKDFLFLS